MYLWLPRFVLLQVNWTCNVKLVCDLKFHCVGLFALEKLIKLYEREEARPLLLNKILVRNLQYSCHQ